MKLSAFKPITSLWLVLLVGMINITSSWASQSDPQVLLMMSGHGSKAKAELLKNLAKDQPFTLTDYSTKGKTDEEVSTDWGQADLILLDGINPALSKMMFAKYQPNVALHSKVAVISLGDPNNPKMNQGVAAEQQSRIGEYYKHAGRDNYRNMMLYMSNQVFKLSDEQATMPRIVPNVGLYHPDYPQLMTSDAKDFYQWLSPSAEQNRIAIGIHRSVVDYEQQQVVDALIKGLEAKGNKAFAFFFEGNDESLTYPELLTNEKGPLVDLMINYRALHYVAKRRAEFEQIGVPVIHALNYGDGDEAQYLEDHTGVSASLTPFFLVMPEDTGSTDPIVITAKKDGNKVVMQMQLDALIERASNHAKLSHMANADKKVATFIWNYPPGEKNIGAAFLDVPGSIEQIAKRMAEQGYQVTPKQSKWLIENAGLLLRPYYRQEDASQLIGKGLADYLPLATYLEWFDQLPEAISQPIIDRWGKVEDNAMLTEHNGELAFVIPRMDLGNMIVLPQGVRGSDAKEHSNLYHDTKNPINHSYLAIYLYTREVFNANAYIHLGTHGSLEWLTGKERGLSVYDAPSLAAGNLPIFYPYIIDNVGEAMQAKRRGRATIISHLTPGFAKAGLYTDIAKLNELISNYPLLEQGQTKQNTRQAISNDADKLHILKDIQLTQAELNASTDVEFNNQLAKIQDHLTELSEQSQPLGVHIFGLLPQQAHLYSTMLQMLGDEFVSEAKIYEAKHGLAIPKAERKDHRDVTKLEALDGFQLLMAHIQGKALKDITPESALAKGLKTADEYWVNFQNIAELDNLLGALSGKYIPVSYGGDPIRNPQAAPTGRNLIGFNPAKVPSKEAYLAGVELMDQTIADYREKHGRYPEKLAFSLWSLETMRHHGALEAQILHALGLKPVWDERGDISDTEIIPYKTLGRPRIDVVISATGLYRDAFPNVMLWLAEAIDKIAKMKEDNNFVYRHSMTLKQELIDSGQTNEEADYLSSIRIFSNESGNYGTGLAASSLASDTWETDDKLADLYLKRMGYAFGKDESRWSENTGASELYSKVLSGTDAAIFSRSTNLYALMTNDDPFQYFGGLGLAVRHLDGKTPEMYVSNLRRKDKLKSQTMSDFLNQEMRSRYFHPRWIKAMQDSGYAGATAILDRMNNMWGWEVMTPEAVRDDHWQEFFEVYVDDKYQMEMKAFFEEHNAEALAQIIERMLEAARKGYWQPDAATLEKMLETYTELANKHDVVTDNTKFNEYVQTQNAGFGLAPLAPGAAAQPQVDSAASAAKPTEQVSGQKLEQVKAQETESDDEWIFLLIGLIFAAGIVRHRFESAPKQETHIKHAA